MLVQTPVSPMSRDGESAYLASFERPTANFGWRWTLTKRIARPRKRSSACARAVSRVGPSTAEASRHAVVVALSTAATRASAATEGRGTDGGRGVNGAVWRGD